MLALSKGDIVIAYFPQEDNSAVNLRPCLVLSVEEDHFLAAKITTTALHRIWTYKLPEGREATSSGCIQKDSWINLRRCETIPIQDAKRIVATLKPGILTAIFAKLTGIIDI